MAELGIAGGGEAPAILFSGQTALAGKGQDRAKSVAELSPTSCQGWTRTSSSTRRSDPDVAPACRCWRTMAGCCRYSSITGLRETVAGSYYRVSAPVTPALEGAVAAIVAALDYTGVAMFEFRLTDAGDGAAGARLGAAGSQRAPMGVDAAPRGAGGRFPVSCGSSCWSTAWKRRGGTYRTGVFGRNLVPDFWSTVQELRRHPRGVAAAAGRRRALRMIELGRGVTGREVHDVLVRDDPAPGLLEMQAIGGSIGARVTRRMGLASGPSPGRAHSCGRWLQALRGCSEAMRATAGEGVGGCSSVRGTSTAAPSRKRRCVRRLDGIGS